MPSVLKGSVSDVTFDNVALGGTPTTNNASVPIDVLDGAETPYYTSGGPRAELLLERSVVNPGNMIHLEAEAPPDALTKDWTYLWSFGDGTFAKGRHVRHRFPDNNGTLGNGDGRFRVLLEIRDKAGRHGRAYAPVLVVYALKPAAPVPTSQPGLAYQAFIPRSTISPPEPPPPPKASQSTSKLPASVRARRTTPPPSPAISPSLETAPTPSPCSQTTPVASSSTARSWRKHPSPSRRCAA